MPYLNSNAVSIISKCSRCGSTSFRKCGKSFRDHRKIQNYQCKGCGKIFRVDEPESGFTGEAETSFEDVYEFTG